MKSWLRPTLTRTVNTTLWWCRNQLLNERSQRRRVLALALPASLWSRHTCNTPRETLGNEKAPTAHPGMLCFYTCRASKA